MNKLSNIDYCKKCLNKKFDPKNGIICGLTNQKADFEDQCQSFDIDVKLINSELSKQQSSSKELISFGFSPRYSQDRSYSDLSNKELLVLAVEAAKILKWNLSMVNNSGLVAYTSFSIRSWGEEIKVSIEVANVSVKSECTGLQLTDLGKNRKNIDSFFALIDKLKEQFDFQTIEEKFKEISNLFSQDNDGLTHTILEKKEKISNPFALLIPSKEYLITPIIAIINLLIFAIMWYQGAGLFWFVPELMIKWGANVSQLTYGGEWWRLLTSNYLHFDVVHLLLNVWALVYIGVIIEPYLGKSRFLSAYILTGVAGSVASLYWNEIIISAGASGAVFGLFGVFFALLSTKLIEKSARKSLLLTIAFFIAFNLIEGNDEGVDRAAHIGGLIAGIIVGFAFYPSLKYPDKKIYKPISIAWVALFVSTTLIAVVQNKNTDILDYQTDMEEFVELEEKTLFLTNSMEYSNKSKRIEFLQNEAIPNWERCLTIAEQAENYSLPELLAYKNGLLIEYCQLRIESYNDYLAIAKDSVVNFENMKSKNNRIRDIIYELTSLQ